MTTPNILWICSDQQRFDTLGCCGNPLVDTPNLDRLAASGMLFERAFCQNPVCTPSRASFLTGRYPRTTRCRQNGQCMPGDEILVPRLLTEQGYACGLSGKLHISACNPSTGIASEPRINDGYCSFAWSHHPAPSNRKANWVGDGYTHWLKSRGKRFTRTPSSHSRFVQFGMPEEDHQTTWCAEMAIRFMETAAEHERPWLFSVNMFDPHHPFDPPAEYLERHLDRLARIPLPNYTEGELSDRPIWQQIDHRGAYGGNGMAYGDLSDADHRLVRAAYWAMVELIDAQVGRLLDALEQTGQRDNTIVIFHSDHGEMLGDHGIYLKGPYFYEPAVHIPLVMSWPGHIPGGIRSPALVELTDLAPTLMEATGGQPHPGMQGRSLWPMLTGKAPAERHRDSVYCEFYNASFHYDPKPFATMVRTATHKLVAAHGRNEGEMYDLEADPEEQRNLWHDPAMLALKADLLKTLCDRMAETVDPLPERIAVW